MMIQWQSSALGCWQVIISDYVSYIDNIKCKSKKRLLRGNSSIIRRSCHLYDEAPYTCITTTFSQQPTPVKL
jgi:hypothetical protein